MGVVIQLVFLPILLMIPALLVGTLIAGLSLTTIRITGKVDTESLVRTGFTLPLKLIPYLFLSLIANMFFCEYVRNVDAPHTDYWTVPVASEFKLQAIDTLDEWHLYPKEGGEPIIANVIAIGVTESFIYGLHEGNGYYVYELQTSVLSSFLSKEEYGKYLQSQGAIASPISPNEYYRNNRITGDLISLLVILLYPLYKLYKFGCQISSLPFNESSHA